MVKLLEKILDELDWINVMFAISGLSFGIGIMILWVQIDDIREWGAGFVTIMSLFWLGLGIGSVYMAVYTKSNKEHITIKK